MKRKKLLDSFALLAYLNKETNFERVKQILAKAQKSGDFVLMNEINIGETYYILFRKRGAQQAEFFIDTILPGLPIAPVPNTFESILDVARIKAEYPLSFSDCFAVSNARRENAIIVTGDPEFKNVNHMVEIEWLVEKTGFVE
ncbi:MAG: type II toxin-antitoxin system VapC family toxin [Deltaproteobacteria bacterium]|nr:type II toxin-antitoxin system VapC family toxin [Deltaproteobacteria bacterium]MBW2450479.1 type II toxin-antitoxin system VapC family toxin [Deltaproteobacteria bacterium]MBW2492046.1 type II toxin-antitoxin system VapC family toxin [Deltaproteobacteria bacterium]